MKLGERWVAIDPMLHHWDVSLPDIDAAFDLRTWLEDQGYRVIETQILTPERQYFPPLFLSCVEVVKRVIGMQNPLIITPYQLYRYFKFKH
ncbi:MAG: hypothetical protein RBR86_06100 [Pseudobdellovibrionaceae bacterium]|nr:hypothetical protein [Pseudobdellovibrionaceae bacterium]